MITACATTAFTQDINFSQFYELPLLRNPALAANFKGDVRVMASCRSQWGSVTVPYQTQSLAAEIKIPAFQGDYITLGMQATNDIAGDSKMGRTQFFPMAAFSKCINEEKNSYLSIGVLGGAVQQRFDASQLKFDDQFVNGAYSAMNPTKQTFSSQQLLYWDLNMGLSYSTQIGNTEAYIGASYFHLTQPKVAFDRSNDFRLNRKIVVNGGLSIAASDENRMILYMDYFVQGGNSQWQGGLLYKHDLTESNNEDAEKISISAGSFYRWNDAVIPVVKLDYYKVALGMSYDVNISKLKPASQLRGAYEVTLVYRDFLNAYNDELRKTRCPVRF